MQPSPSSLLGSLPPVRGKLREHAELSKVTWFRTGGAAEVLFRPADVDDLANFLSHRPGTAPYTVMGVGSNLLVRDGGVPGIVIRLGRGFATLEQESKHIIFAGAAVLDAHLAQFACDLGLGGLEFFSGIPGTVGGALAMNAGAYGRDTAGVLAGAEILDSEGTRHVLTPAEIGYAYRHCDLPEGWIFTGAWFEGVPEDPKIIAGRMATIAEERQLSQPVRSRTGGSTFKNPPGQKAWQLIDAAGCRGMQHGGAQVSEQHCNFLLNTGNATAADLETLGETIRKRVRDHNGTMLEWEIKRIGKK